ncbi:hypothetical protein ACN28S_67450 [Cystobacter fuscus]
MARAWKDKHGIGMGGLLIDTLAHNFLESTTEYDNRSFLYFDWMSRDFCLSRCAARSRFLLGAWQQSASQGQEEIPEEGKEGA